MMAVEKIRCCGYRKVGGIYLVGDGIALPCDRLPLNLPELCEACGAGIKPHRGFQWINPLKLLNVHGGEVVLNEDESPELIECIDGPECFICNPPNDSSGLMWVGNRYYTPKQFTEEAIERGVSKRISQIPKELEIGKTLILLAHRKAGLKTVDEETNFGTTLKKKVICHAIFYAFKPQRIEKLIWKSEATAEELDKLKNRGITPVIIPDGDKDHDPKTSITQDLKNHKQPKYKDFKDAF